MRLPSLRSMMAAARQTFTRFPSSILAAIAGSLAALAVVEWDIAPTNPWYVLNTVFVAATLAIALCAACVFTAERAGLSRGRSLGLQGVCILLVAGYGLSLPVDIYSPPFLYGIRHWLLLLGVHLLVAFAAFLRRGETRGFWQFNRILFLRLLVALLYTCVLMAGLSIALAAVNNLFELSIRPERYLQLWIVLLGIFNTWFFLSGVPERLDELETDSTYPRGLKLFTQYVLLPLVVVYLVILYAYLVKILVTWDWPKGWVANLVLGFSITGVFSLLLVHPLVHRGEERWVLRFSRWFYIAEIPLVVVLLLAIGRRVQEYGITENRYFVVVMGLWLAVITLYFLFSKHASIKVIPASLFALSFLVSVGPWGAFEVSKRSQMHRLAARLQENGILADGKMVRRVADVPAEDAREISSAVRYLVEIHGSDLFRPWLGDRLDTLAQRPQSGSDRMAQTVSRRIVAAMGVQYVEPWQGGDGYRRFLARKPAAVRVEGTTFAVRGIMLVAEGRDDSAALEGRLVRVSLRAGSLALRISRDSTLIDSGSVNLVERIRSLVADTTTLGGDALPIESLLIRAAVGGTSVTVVPSRIDVASEKGGLTIRRFEGDLFLGSGGPARGGHRR